MRLLFYLLILLMPTQLGRHFWPDFSFIQGIRVDYLSPTIYLTDILIATLVTGWLISLLKKSKIKNQKSKLQFKISNFLKQYWPLGAFIAALAISINSSTNPFAGLYGLLKLTEFALFGVFIAKTIKEREFKKVLTLLCVGVIFESLLAIFQFVNQSSIGGPFWFLGERTFTGQTPGIANAVIEGQLVLRPYGTFSHPNVLAGYLTVAMVTVIFNFQFSIFNFKRLLFTFSLLIGTLGLLLTMSRVAILVWLLILSLWFLGSLRKNKFAIYFLLFTILIIGIIVYPRFANFSLNDETFVRRQELTTAALEMTKQNPLIGVGLNNFLVNLPEYQKTKSAILYLQPVHNIYLLALAETGIVGLGVFLWLIKKTYKRIMKHKSGLFIILTSILVLGLFDHYLLTLQQGQLLFALVLGLCWNGGRKPSSPA